MVKKIKILLISIVLVGFITGCANESSIQDTPNNYTLAYDSTDITPGHSFNENAINLDYNYSEIPSCAFSGIDKVYNYDSFEITVSNVNNEEKIYSVYINDDTLKTDKGIKVSDSLDNLKKAYGNNYIENGSAYSYKDNNVEVSFIVENDVIISIQYTLIVK